MFEYVLFFKIHCLLLSLLVTVFIQFIYRSKENGMPVDRDSFRESNIIRGYRAMGVTSKNCVIIKNNPRREAINKINIMMTNKY